MNLFTSQKPHYEHLRKKWVSKHRKITEKFSQKHGGLRNKLALTGIGSMLLLANPTINLAQEHLLTDGAGQITKDTDNNALLAADLKDEVPNQVRSLTPEEEAKISQTLSDHLGYKVSAEVDNKRLNRSYGVIGGEQHLYRYPGDSLNKQFSNTTEWAMYGPAGVAPGLGAWGYFAPSESQLTQKDVEREKYYIAVQTFLSPGFSERVAEYRDFYKYRKMVVVNPETGQTVIVDIADAGPAEWTGKHLGGSPEVMHYLGLASGPRKGPVLYFFVDDPKDEIPLGPVKLENRKLAKS